MIILLEKAQAYKLYTRDNRIKKYKGQSTPQWSEQNRL
jgi:hypothetical protein